MFFKQRNKTTKKEYQPTEVKTIVEIKSNDVYRDSDRLLISFLPRVIEELKLGNVVKVCRSASKGYCALVCIVP
jgi:hypothetical protein